MPYKPETYGAAVAEYFDTHLALSDTDACVEYLDDLVERNSRVCELGVGTGRIALPLSDRGHRVLGVEVSDSMIRRLSEKDPSGRVEVLNADIVELGFITPQNLIYCVDVTLNMLADQGDQVKAIDHASKNLAPNGHFVVETTVPPLCDLWKESITVASETGDFVEFARYEHDIGKQTLTGQVTAWSASNMLATYRTSFRYLWPSELDLMCRLSGLQLKERVGAWNRAAYRPGQTRFISTYVCTDSGSKRVLEEEA